MTISIGRIIGALLAIVIVYVLINAGLGLLVSFGLFLHPAISIVVWALFAIFACIAIAWALGISIPFINITR